MITLGINAAFHDCSATLVRDGEVVAAVEEERLTHVKHGKRPVPFTTWQLPFHAIDACLRDADVALHAVDRFAYAFDPHVMLGATWPSTLTLPLEPSKHAAPNATSSPWDALFLASIVNAPRQLVSGWPHHLRARAEGITHDAVVSRWRWVEHHLAHEASAFLASPFASCAVLVMDGRGERATTSLGHWADGRYTRLRQIDVPHSLGLVYEAVTRWLGFLHSSDEYKVMALASFGRPEHVDAMRRIVQLSPDGGAYTVPPFDLDALFGPARAPGGAIEQRHLDVACSLQVVLEDTALALADWLHARTGESALCLAGGVALNCVMNAKVRDRGPFEHVWVQPAAGDAGTALGAALWVDARERAAHDANAPGLQASSWQMTHALLGPSFDDAQIEASLRAAKLPYRRLDDVADDTAALLAQDRIVGWMQGRMEFGPRALGARSILASPTSPQMQQRLNALKDREDFRPVAPMVLEERASQWFSSARASAWPAPFMVFTFDVDPTRRDRIPAVQHVDGTARVQTVDAARQPLVHALLSAFERRTGVPVLVNTSFNVRGKPIVCTPRDALEAFWTSPLDALVIGSFCLEKPTP